ncbi:MAG: SpoIIE family protein phosphatase [Pirellulales bacterium]|nr:SpoIIE family protein phosphatase [Pirellulales bacterium]
MPQAIPPYLKLRAVDAAEVVRPDIADLDCLADLCRTFAEATGFPLRYVPSPEPTDDLDLLWSAPVNPGVGATPGHLRIDLSRTPADGETWRIDWHAAESLATAIGQLVNEAVAARHALWQREAELAAGVPVTPHANEETHLALRLEATLQAGVKAIHADSAALYLLDEATSQLKLRAASGMPIAKFQEPARELSGQLADLEALLGHAVALESRKDMVGSWRSPEPAGAALCVPVSSPTVPLGTLWFFNRRARTFTDEQTNVAEVIAAKIASDLDRAVLLDREAARSNIEREMTAAKRSQEHQLPITPPPLAGWKIAGWAAQASSLGGAFYDWRLLDDDTLLVLLGDASDGGIEAALSSAALRAALRTNDRTPADLRALLAQANRVLWESSAGGWWAGLWAGEINLKDGRCEFASAGRPSAMCLSDDRWLSLLKPQAPLGLEPIFKPQPKQIILTPGESLVVCNRGIMDAVDERGRPMEEAALARSLMADLSGPPDRLIDIVCDRVAAHAVQPDQWDRSILIVKRLAE